MSGLPGPFEGHDYELRNAETNPEIVPVTESLTGDAPEDRTLPSNDEIRDHFEQLPIQANLTERQMVRVLLKRIAALEEALRDMVTLADMDQIPAPNACVWFNAFDRRIAKCRRALLKEDKL